MEHHYSRFERGILKVVAFIGFARFIVAFLLNDPIEDGYQDLYLDIVTAGVFLMGVILVQLKANSKLIVALFFAPLVGLLWISFYFQNGLAGASEINAFAVVIILSLTIQGKPLAFVGLLVLGIFAILYFVTQENSILMDIATQDVGNTTLLIVTLANIMMIFHAKNVFDSSRSKLNLTNQNLLERRDEIKRKREQLAKQNEQLTFLKEELEEKVLERTKKLKHQKKSIGEYMQLTLTELTKSYKKTITEIQNLENSTNDEMIKMVKISGEKLELEVENLKKRLVNSNE
jgi:hypothetical protein